MGSGICSSMLRGASRQSTCSYRSSPFPCWGSFSMPASTCCSDGYCWAFRKRLVAEHGRAGMSQKTQHADEGLEALPAVEFKVETLVVEEAPAGLEADVALAHVALDD